MTAVMFRLSVFLLVEQKLPILPISPPIFSRIRVTRSLVFCVCFVDRCLSFCPFSFDHCVVCSSIYGFWLPLQTLLINRDKRDVRFRLNVSYSILFLKQPWSIKTWSSFSAATYNHLKGEAAGCVSHTHR